MDTLIYLAAAVIIVTFAFLWSAFRKSGRELDDHDSLNSGAVEGSDRKWWLE